MESLSLATPHPTLTTGKQKLALALAGIGVVLLLLVWAAQNAFWPVPMLLSSLGLMVAGTWLFVHEEYVTKPEGIKNNGVWFKSLSARGVWGWLAAVIFTGFYTVLYFCPATWLVGLSELFSPLSQLLKGQPADKWFVYGSLYTFSVLVLGVKFIYKYRHNRYQIIRTISVMFFQMGFAFLIPAFMQMMSQPEYYFTYFWPLKDYYGSPSAVQYYGSATSISVYFIAFSALMTVVATPVLTYFFGKRWYCSWVCGCGGLAETAGDSFRHLSDKSLKAWKIERWMIHSVLVAVTLMTGLLWVNSYQQGGVLGSFSQGFSTVYGYVIGMAFSGVVGVGFYPLMGSRVWCRFGCPQAAILGIFQKKKSKFRITTNGGQCISCGNCSTYCEMGIDVRAYAQKGQDVVRASCVGCGICAAVCPRGVLRLEGASGDIAERTTQMRTVHIKLEDVKML
ncbi:MAG: 4Fe-4S binding protein [Saprospiraceae bacterium]